MTTSAIWHILVPVCFALILNGIIYTKQWSQQSNKSLDHIQYIPSGYIVGTIWVVLFGLLGYTHYLLYPNPSVFIIYITFVYCLSYPILTRLLYNKAPLYNTVALLIIITAAFIVLHQNKKAFVFMIPLMMWVSYVNIIDSINCARIYNTTSINNGE